ncbi:putative holin-like toxin [Lactobacillus delbrueckii]
MENYCKGKVVMSVYEALSLMLTFEMFVIALLTYVDKHSK